MITTIKSKQIDRQGAVHILIGILVFGSIWGFFEATLGGFLHMIIFPNKGAIMGGIGVALMASALAIYKKPGMLLGIGIVAASFKLLDVLILSLPFPKSNYVDRDEHVSTLSSTSGSDRRKQRFPQPPSANNAR